MNEYKIHARGWIERHAQDISDWHQIIWRLAEPAWREYRSAAWYVDRLRKEGFTVEEGSAGMPPAFCAVWENGKGGPTVGAYAEYDATPANSQEQVPYECPREGLNRYAAGHTDPHSALGMGSLAGVLAAKDAMRRYGIPGRIKFFGEPAEKMCGSKPLHAANGYYDDVDAFISFHPSCRLSLCNTVYWDIHCGSSYGRVFTFECTHPETWGEAHGRMLMPLQQVVARAPGALDAVCLMYTTSRYTNTSMLPRSGGWYISEAILVGGQATADHLAPRLGQIYYCWRAPTLEMQDRIAEVLENNAKHVAAITHCEVRGDWVQKNRIGLPNHALARLAYRNMELAGPPQFGEEAQEFGRQILRNLGHTPPERPIMPECSVLHDPLEADRALREGLPPWQTHFMSDDYVEYTWHAPTVRLFIGRCMVERPDDAPEHVLPMWVWNAMGGKRECIDPTIFSAARTIGYTVLDLMACPDELARAKAEFAERTGGGIGGSRWIAPLMPAGAPAPVHFRWPEYISTPRGEQEWWIPQDAR